MDCTYAPYVHMGSFFFFPSKNPVSSGTATVSNLVLRIGLCEISLEFFFFSHKSCCRWLLWHWNPLPDVNLKNLPFFLVAECLLIWLSRGNSDSQNSLILNLPLLGKLSREYIILYLLDKITKIFSPFIFLCVPECLLTQVTGNFNNRCYRIYHYFGIWCKKAILHN